MNKRTQNFQLVHHTALAFTLEKDNQAIQAIRQKHDSAYTRWQPHINFCYPFVDIGYFESTHKLLQAKFQKFAPFQITFKFINSFSHGTIYLVPQTNGDQLRQIYDIISQAIPPLKLANKFCPHMTIAKQGNTRLIQTTKNEFKKDWKQLKVKCDGITMIEREGDTPFKTYKKIQFKG